MRNNDAWEVAPLAVRAASIPFLENKETELALARAWYHHKDVAARDALLLPHLRLVRKMARKFGPVHFNDLFSEGMTGLVKAVNNFNPERGFRFSTYARWWVDAYIKEYWLRNSHSIVGPSQTGAQKKLFFNLGRVKDALGISSNGDLSPENILAISKKLEVPPDDVILAHMYLSNKDVSLNASSSHGGEDDRSWEDKLVSGDLGPEEKVINIDQDKRRHEWLLAALETLSDREKRIIVARRLAEPTVTLEDLGAEYGVSRERIRQIEGLAYKKMERLIRAAAANVTGEALNAPLGLRKPKQARKPKSSQLAA